MRVSQLLHVLDKDDDIVIEDGNKRITNMTLYEGTPRGIKRDDPINKMHVNHICYSDGVLYVLAERQEYFTPEQVRKMSPAEVRENYSAIMASMKKWR